jgi:hypothetical protein
MVSRMLGAAGRRVGQADPEQLTDLIQLRDLVDQAIIGAVAGLRHSGSTWQEIGDACGTTRQAAIMRYGPHINGSTAAKAEA